ILANAITALAGSLFAQWSGFFSITGNIGTLIAGLASLMIAELLSVSLSMLVVVAATLYQSIFAATLYMGIDPRWNNLLNASIMILLMLLSKNIFRTVPGRKYAESK